MENGHIHGVVETTMEPLMDPSKIMTHTVMIEMLRDLIAQDWRNMLYIKELEFLFLIVLKINLLRLKIQEN